jgi:hypothetical protein
MKGEATEIPISSIRAAGRTRAPNTHHQSIQFLLLLPKTYANLRADDYRFVDMFVLNVSNDCLLLGIPDLVFPIGPHGPATTKP